MPINPRNTALVTVSVPLPIARQIERRRKAEHRSRSEVVRDALRLYLKALPDIEEAGRQAYLDAKAGKGLSPVFETVEQGQRWLARERRKARRKP
jgi:Arc/MetJ-type ribon-helix-helix transcriptional regulator